MVVEIARMGKTWDHNVMPTPILHDLLRRLFDSIKGKLKDYEKDAGVDVRFPMKATTNIFYRKILIGFSSANQTTTSIRENF
jgi:hypothetical protein